MNTGISTACFFGRIYNEEALKEIAALGVKQAEIFFSGRTEYRTEYAAELQQIADGEGVEIEAVHALPTQFEPQLFSRHERQFQEALGVFRDVLQAAEMLGAQTYVFHGPVRLKTARKMEIDFAFAGDRIALLCECAKEYNVALCMENVHWCWYQQPGFAQELMKHTDSNNLFFALDIKQAAQSGYAAPEYIQDMGGNLRHVHICDYRMDKEKGVLPCLPFHGETDWEGIRRSLGEINFTGQLMLEVYSNNYKEYAELKECYDEVTQFFG